MDSNLTLITVGELPARMNNPFHYQLSTVMLAVVADVRRAVEEIDCWQDEVGRGKMFGVLIVRDAGGRVGYLKTYSGQIGGREDWEGWVPAVYDYLQPDGYFAVHENEISRINSRIAELERSPRLSIAAARLAKAQKSADDRVGQARRFVAEQKAQRNKRRADGEDEAVLVAESQYQKAELRRLKKQVEAELLPLREAVDGMRREIAELRSRRKRMSDDLQMWLFEQFVMLNADGESMTLNEIFAPTPQRVPPAGAGECCAPKLLQYAYRYGYTPLEIAEFWWGESPRGEVRRHMEFYPACQGKCKPILDFMLKGAAVEPNPFECSPSREADGDAVSLPVVFKDDWVVVVDKPSGMLSVPGKTGEVSALEMLQFADGVGCKVYPVHRLDMQTSGLLVFALDKTTQAALQREFEGRCTMKQYVAVVEGTVSPRHGTMFAGKSGTVDLPLASDYDYRPCQKVDYENGKVAVTEYMVECVEGATTRLRLTPHHGRTHQLRVHCAHADGLGMPIVGDNLYGHHGRRMLLHAERLTLHNAVADKVYELYAPCPY